MSTAIHFTFDPRDEGVLRRDWDPWAQGNGLSIDPGSAVWRKGQIEVDYHTKRRVAFSTFYMGEEMTGLVLLALAFWLRFGGQMTAPPEVMIRIHQAFLAMNPVPQAVTP